jgi:hypothetical protein
MAQTVRVEAAVLGRRRAGTAEHPLEIDVAPGPIAARELIVAIVRAEVAAYEARAEERTFVRVLTEQAIDEGLTDGAVRSGGADPVGPVDVGAAGDAALLAFDDGLYHCYVDDEQVESLDDPVALTESTRVLFLRLVALAGG